MSALNSGMDSIAFLHTGAIRVDEAQLDPAVSIGGYRSSTRVQSFVQNRADAAPGLRILNITNPTAGIGVISAISENLFRYQAPGDNIAGDETEIKPGEKKNLVSDTITKYITIYRLDDGTVPTPEVFSFVDSYLNAIAGDHFTEDLTSGEYHYRGLFVRNLNPDFSVTDFELWVTDNTTLDRVNIGVTSTGSSSYDEAEQLADQYTKPIFGVTWYTPTEISPITKGTLLSGYNFIMWIETGVDPTPDRAAKHIVELGFSFTLDGDSYSGTMRGILGVGVDWAEPWELFLKKDSPADPDIDSPLATSADGTFTVDPSFTQGVWYRDVYKKNRWGERSPAAPQKIYYIDSSLDEENAPPAPPSIAEAVPAAAGTFLINGVYFPVQEQVLTNRATKWLLYESYDGTDPDPDLDSPLVIDMEKTAGIDRVQLLHYTTSPQQDKLPAKFLLRTRRVEGIINYDSENLTPFTADAEVLGPLRVKPYCLMDGNRGITNPVYTIDPETVYIDMGLNIRWEIEPGRTCLYADTSLIWCYLANINTFFVPTEFELRSGTLVGTGSTPIVVVDWSATLKRILFYANGNLAMEITGNDTSGNTNEIEVNQFSFSQVLTSLATHDPVWVRFIDMIFQGFDNETENPEAYADLDPTAILITAVTDHTKTQAQIEAL